MKKIEESIIISVKQHSGKKFASILLDIKGAVKRNYDVPITSTTKLKKHKVRDKSIQTYF